MKKYIYKITNLINNKIYIGQTNNPKRRWQEHKNLGYDTKETKLLYRAIKKYGKDNFVFEIIEGPIDNYNEKEIKEIQKKIVLFLSKVVYDDRKNLIMEKFERNKYMSVSYIFKHNNKCRFRCNVICKENINNN